MEIYKFCFVTEEECGYISTLLDGIMPIKNQTKAFTDLTEKYGGIAYFYEILLKQPRCFCAKFDNINECLSFCAFLNNYKGFCLKIDNKEELENVMGNDPLDQGLGASGGLKDPNVSISYKSQLLFKATYSDGKYIVYGTISKWLYEFFKTNTNVGLIDWKVKRSKKGEWEIVTSE